MALFVFNWCIRHRAPAGGNREHEIESRLHIRLIEAREHEPGPRRDEQRIQKIRLAIEHSRVGEKVERYLVLSLLNRFRGHDDVLGGDQRIDDAPADRRLAQHQGRRGKVKNDGLHPGQHEADTHAALDRRVAGGGHPQREPVVDIAHRACAHAREFERNARAKHLFRQLSVHRHGTVPQTSEPGRMLAVPTALVRTAAALAAATLVVAWPDVPRAQSAASLRGRVTIGIPISTRRPANAYSRAAQATNLAPVSELRNVVVYLKDAKRGAVQPSRAEIRQVNETFVPRAVAVTVGSEVSFPNADPFYHNVFSLSRARTFDLGRYPTGQTRTVRFDKPGLVKVFCQIHSHMSASVMVFEHPWFSVPNEDGRFSLADVPAGPHKLVAWHERLGETTVDVQVDAGRAATIDFVLPVPRQ